MFKILCLQYIILFNRYLLYSLTLNMCMINFIARYGNYWLSLVPCFRAITCACEAQNKRRAWQSSQTFLHANVYIVDPGCHECLCSWIPWLLMYPDSLNIGLIRIPQGVPYLWHPAWHYFLGYATYTRLQMASQSRWIGDSKS